MISWIWITGIVLEVVILVILCRLLLQLRQCGRQWDQQRPGWLVQLRTYRQEVKRLKHLMDEGNIECVQWLGAQHWRGRLVSGLVSRVTTPRESG